MHSEPTTTNNSRRLRRKWQYRALFAISLLWVGPALACGSFVQRPEPTPTPLTLATPISTEPTATATLVVVLDATPAPPIGGPVATLEATTALTPTLPASAGLTPGQPARVVAVDGLNMRDQASTNGTLLLRLPPNQKVTVVEGPIDADGFRWWKVDDGQGNVGWVAERDGETEWLSPRLGAPQPVDRAPRVGDRVKVTMESGGPLSVRITPGTDAEVVTRVNVGDEFSVTGGPQESGGYTWFQVRSDDGTIEGWAAAGDDTERWLSPLE